MSTGFDAYYKWLSIPPHDQPPNHYRLLGLGLFESDPDVIAAAADRQMAHVQTYKNGPHSELSQKLLNEIAAAKLCLLRPQKKSAYDQQLRKQMAVEASRVGPLGAAVVPQSPQQPMAPQESLPAASDASKTVPEAVRHAGYPGTSFTPPPPTLPPPVARRALSLENESPRPNVGMTTVLITAGAFAVLLAIGILVALKSRADHSLPSPSGGAKRNAGQALPDANREKSSNAPVASSNGQSQNSGSRIVIDTKRSSTAQPTATTAKVNSSPSMPPSVQPRQPSVARSTAPPANQQLLPKSDATKPATKPSPIKPVQPTLPPGKAVVPDATAIAAINTRLGDLSAAQPADLVDQAHKATDPAEVYVLLRRTIDAAIKQGDAATAISATDELVRRFAVDSLQVRWRIMDDLRKHADSPKSWAALANCAAASIDEATAAGNRDLAERFAELSISAARISNDVGTIRRVTLRIIHMRPGRTPVSKPSTPP